MKILALLTILSVCSCAPRAVVVSGVPTAPPSVSPVAPSARAAVKSASEAGAVSVKLEGQVQALQQKTADLREGIAASVAEAERLRLQKSASESEIDALWRMLAGHELKVRDLFAEAEAARETAAEQRDLRLKLERDLADVVQRASARDSEAETLRLQRDDLANAVKASALENGRLRSELTEADRKAAVGSYLQRWVLGIAVAVFAGFCIWALIKFYRPIPFVG